MAGIEPAISPPQTEPIANIVHSVKWRSRWDSNPQPVDYKSTALPIEPLDHMAVYWGIEPQSHA